ncbi:hypothetical protein cyc_02589 [Cyclospora cayetanensis]|uniref:Uncharacterized protein n=1 Tax=Cyclospora cayetanensis TaxID=88456 RepID=A0A1D3CUQ6_9EIME|nr:hypothetical protein cyc_02589 [Cyclospora cayetanensis]
MCVELDCGPTAGNMVGTKVSRGAFESGIHDSGIRGSSNEESSRQGKKFLQSGGLDARDSMTEYLLQLHGASPLLHPVPCASFFTVKTTVKDLTDYSNDGNYNCSTMAKDLFVAIEQRPPEANPKAFKAFARAFHAVALQRIAATKTCSVCGASWQQQQVQNEQHGADQGDWGLCLLPHLNPSQQIKSYTLPQVACGMCIRVLGLSWLLAAAATNVAGEQQPECVTSRHLTATLEHYRSVNSVGGLDCASKQPCWDGSSENSWNALKQQKAAAGSCCSSFKALPHEVQQRALDISIATAFSIEQLAKEIPWKLKGPTGSLKTLIEALGNPNAATAVALSNQLLLSAKEEPDEVLQRPTKQHQQQHHERLVEKPPQKTKKHNSGGSCVSARIKRKDRGPTDKVSQAQVITSRRKRMTLACTAGAQALSVAMGPPEREQAKEQKQTSRSK